MTHGCLAPITACDDVDHRRWSIFRFGRLTIERMRSPAKPPRLAVRRSLSWSARATISIAIPLACGAVLASTGVPRQIYNNAWRFWSAVGLHDPTPIQMPARQARTVVPPLNPRLRYITEGLIYTVMIVPAFLLAIFIYDRLTFRYCNDRVLRCLHCGYILKGLTEPRCPECGTKI